MFFKKYIYHLLFLLAYIGALVIEKPVYSVATVQGCLSYLFTVLIHFCLFGLMIAANNHLLIPHLLTRKRFGLYIAGLIALVLLYTSLVNHYNSFIHLTLFHDELIKTSAGFWDNFVYALCCSVIASMLYITRQWSQQQDQVKNIEISQLQTELKYLRSQINPHFLFNGLNTVYGYIDMNNDQARNMMVQFSDLLRYNLYEADVDLISLEKEIKYLENYVALQKARSNDNIKVSFTANYQDGAVKIAPLLFMAFVENAFKHVSRADQMINTIVIRVTEEAGRVDFNCENSFEEAETAQGGIGLTNAIRRLELLYDNRFQLDLGKEHNNFKVNLKLIL